MTQTYGTTWLVANAASGSNDDAALEAVRSGLASAGAQPAREMEVAEAAKLSAADLAAAGVDLLVVFAGDGTINSTLTAVEGWQGKVLLLPGGTTNLLARALHGDDCTAESVLVGLAEGRMRTQHRSAIVYSDPSGSEIKALCEILAGPGATWSTVREELREGTLRTVAESAIDAARQSNDDASQIRLTEPAMGNEAGYSGVRLVPEGDAIIVDGYGAQTTGEYLQQGIALLRRNFRDGPHDELGGHQAVTCTSVDGQEMAVMVDGEQLCAPGQVRFSLAPIRLDLLALME
jgi:hypothetical protein